MGALAEDLCELVLSRGLLAQRLWESALVLGKTEEDGCSLSEDRRSRAQDLCSLVQVIHLAVRGSLLARPGPVSAARTPFSTGRVG
jgi:hypothetical protein